MTGEIIVTKAGDLDKIEYRDDLIIIVSDPSIPSGPTKRSKRIDASDIRNKFLDWNPQTSDLNAAPLNKKRVGDFLVVIGQANGFLIDGLVLKNGDIMLIQSISGLTTVLKPIFVAGSRKDIVVVTADESPFNTTVYQDILVDVTDGPVEVILPTIHAINDGIKLYAYKGRYEVNNLTISSSEKIHGMADDPIIVNVDNTSINVIWSGDTDGHLLFSI